MSHLFYCHWLATFVALLLLLATGSFIEDFQIQVLRDNHPVSNVSASRGEKLVLDCVAPKQELSVGKISLKWVRGPSNKEVPSAKKQSSNDQQLETEIHVAENNCGIYFCIASDSRGSVYRKAKVSVGMDGDWSSWSQLCDCNQRPRTQRNRTCNNPLPINGGKPCPGSSTEVCTSKCADDHWMEWSEWSECSDGNQFRTRQCAGSKCDQISNNRKEQDCVVERANPEEPQTSSKPPPSRQRKSSSDPSNLVITVAVSSALVGLLLCVAIIACWRRLHLEQRRAYHRSEEDDATQAILLSLTDSGPGISADDYPEDPTLTRELDAVPPGVALLHAPGSFAEALQGIPPPPNPFFVTPGQDTQFGNNRNQEENDQNEDNSTAARHRQDLQSPEEEFAHLKEGITEDELPVADTDNDVPPLDIF